ncbi:thiamine pyrophosphate-binding protein [Gordonia insulae]|uniref:acetolactate synthase n=1 Tax=Gordonia insulae TaxID=2420509 RepID=A0A3G8JIL1_9ACTN|nr:thiamine pyrophosphate-binding protein [Gordonia insulae]AZG44342.1 Acetolactate synthase isozyme 1 large subunit [Gordonia insulae]
MNAESARTRHLVADRIVERLLALQISTVFGVHGANAEDLWAAAVRHPDVTPVTAKHEFGAGAMADGLSRITGAPSAVLTTSGGAALNVVPALGEAYDSRVPVLAVIGSAGRASVGRGGFQDMLSPPDTIDLSRVLSGVVGTCAVVEEPAALDAAFDMAYESLHAGCPAALVIPKDVQAAPAETPSGAVSGRCGAQRPDDPPAAVIDDLARLLVRVAASDGALCIWAGEEASRLRLAWAVSELTELLGATSVVSPGGRDVGGVGCAGVTGVMGHPSALRAVRDAEVCLVLGCRMSLTDRGGFDDALGDATVIHLGAHAPRAPGIGEHIPTPDLTAMVRALIAAVRDHHGERCRDPAPVPIEYLTTPSTDAALPMRTAVELIGAHLPLDSSVFADAGNAGATTIHHLPFGAGRFVVALGMGGMGHAIAAGIGAAIGTARASTRGTARHGAPRSVVIAGDGSFFMHGMELHTAIEYDAPVTLIVLNNNAHGMCVTRESLYFPEYPGSNRFRPTDIAAGVNAMFGDLEVRHADDPDSLRAACAELLNRPGPNCLVVDVDPDEVPPFAPFLTRGTP